MSHISSNLFQILSFMPGLWLLFWAISNYLNILLLLQTKWLKWDLHEGGDKDNNEQGQLG